VSDFVVGVFYCCCCYCCWSHLCHSDVIDCRATLSITGCWHWNGV